MPFCEMCAEEMSQEDHDYCDICPKCLEEWHILNLQKMVDDEDYVSIQKDGQGNITLIED